MISSKDTNWTQIHQNLINKNQSDLSKAGKAFEQFAKLYFLFEPTVRDEYNHVWLFNEVPLEIKEHLGLGNKDYGVDLVLKDQEGRFTVVQCKFKQNQNKSLSWSKDKLPNMLADGDKADFFIIFTNASGIDTHTHSKKKNKLRVFTLGDLIQIAPETIQAMRQHLLGNEVKPLLKKSPRDYQEIAISKVIDGFIHNNRGKLILPCGTGKTLISLWIHERMNPKYTLVLFPSLALLRQTKNEWAANRQEFFPYICVCSEKDIDKGDRTQVHLYEIRGNVSTDPIEIREYLIKHPEVIVFSTYQSLSVVAEAIRGTDIVFDLALCDEAHKTAGSKKGMFGLVHDNVNIRIKKRLYMTATPRILGENAKKQLNEEEVAYVADMSDPKIFGTEFHHMSFKDAIEQGILVDYKIIAMGVSDSEIARAIKERQYVNDDVTADELANNYALEKFMAKYNSGHAITFHSSVNKARGFQERHHELFSAVMAYHVNGKQTTNERNLILKAFEDSLKSVVTNARCLTEGVDVPAIDAVYFCDSKNSKVDIVQAAGRALRRADHLGKQLGYIVVPIFHCHKDELEGSIEEGVFNNLISVVRALSSHDERLVDEIRKIKLSKGQQNSTSNHLVVDGSLNLITIEGLGNLSERVFEQVVSKFRVPYRSFDEARAFVHSLNLKSQNDWMEYYKSGHKPQDIPTHPAVIYKDQGWVNWGDWVGTGRVASQLRAYKAYEAAQKYACSLNLKNREDWLKHCKNGNCPDDIPSYPDHVYKESGWNGWADWLGNSNKKGGWKPYKEAREFVRALKFKTWSDWQEYCESGKKPRDIPSNPRSVYKDKGWINSDNWLGTSNKKGGWRPYEEARSFVHTLSFKGKDEWAQYAKSGNKPDNIPASPRVVYKDKGWKSWGDWLGTGTIATYYLKYRSYETARSFVHDLELKSKDEWAQYAKSGNKPDNIPASPRVVYKDKGWISWGDWLGTGRVANQLQTYMTFEDARTFIHTLNLKSRSEWVIYCKSENKLKDIPKDPSGRYKNKGWISWGDWLGTGRVATYDLKYKPFEEARKFVHSLNIKNQKEWNEYCKSGNKPDDIPSCPYHVYKNKGWISLGDWLGTDRRAKQPQNIKGEWRNFEEARAFVHDLKLMSKKNGDLVVKVEKN